MRKHSLPISIAALLGLAACPDPQARLDEFEDRVVDASVFDAREGSLEDITGEFYVGFEPQPFQGKIYLFIWTTELTENADGTGTLKLTSQSLHYQTRELAKTMGGAVPPPIVLENIPVSASGSFTIPFENALIPADGNAFNPTGDVTLNLYGDSTILNADFYCGTASAESVTVSPAGIQLGGSTFAATRIVTGTRGMDLPATTAFECPASVVDAGMPDAAAFDGGIDAGVIDAALPDASFDASNP